MAFTVADLVEEARESRAHFIKHVTGVTANQWNWKPYPGCKSIHETLVHLLGVDRNTVEMINGGHPDYYKAAAQAEEDTRADGPEGVLQKLATSHGTLCDAIIARYGSADLGDEIEVWGHPAKLGKVLSGLGSENSYHAGQVSFIRMATDPGWDYYKAIYFG